MHIVYFHAIEIMSRQGVLLHSLSQQGMEAFNKKLNRMWRGSTNHDGGLKGPSTLMQMIRKVYRVTLHGIDLTPTPAELEEDSRFAAICSAERPDVDALYKGLIWTTVSEAAASRKRRSAMSKESYAKSKMARMQNGARRRVTAQKCLEAVLQDPGRGGSKE